MMREKKRYILVEMYAPAPEDTDSFKKGLYAELVKCAGQLEYHRMNPHVIEFLAGNRFIVRASLEGTPAIVAALAFVKSVNGAENAFYTLRSSGTLRALREYAKGLGS